jgi:hypothetical protein
MILAVTGSVAALKIPDILKLLLPTFAIKLVTTASVHNHQFSPKNSLIYQRSDKWSRANLSNGIVMRTNLSCGMREGIQSCIFNLENGPTSYLSLRSAPTPLQKLVRDYAIIW